VPHKTKRENSVFRFGSDIKQTTVENAFYRKVVYTGPYSQLTVMSIPAGGETGEENHQEHDKMLFIVRGKGKSILNRRTRDVGKHDVVFVPAGTLHNLANSGRHDLKVFVVYSPPVYAHGTVHKTVEESFEARRNKFAAGWEQ
jgi:mannose-6-phosphate isomerase-like protein (cupin superfamily)